MANTSSIRSRNLFDPNSKTPYKLSRSRLENFLNCPRCFYLDRRLGLEPPGIPPFTLNSAVDELLKREFDIYRAKGIAHPLMKAEGIDAVPFSHPLLNEWREVFKGVQFHHKPTNFIIFGAVDDLWVNKTGELYVVDYKATSTSEAITLEGEYRQAFKRQMEIYQWLLRKQNLKVSDTGYFVYCNADKRKKAFDSKLEFEIQIIPYRGSTDWIETAIFEAHKCLENNELPDYSPGCEHCDYRRAAEKLESHRKKAMPVNRQGELF